MHYMLFPVTPSPHTNTVHRARLLLDPRRARLSCHAHRADTQFGSSPSSSDSMAASSEALCSKDRRSASSDICGKSSRSCAISACRGTKGDWVGLQDDSEPEGPTGL